MMISLRRREVVISKLVLQHCKASPRSSQVTEMIDKLSGREELHSRSVDLLDDTSNHYLNCYGYIAECISKAERKLNMSGNVGGMACTKESKVCRHHVVVDNYVLVKYDVIVLRI